MSMGSYIPKMKNAKIIPQRWKNTRSRIILMGNYIPKMKNTKITPKDEKTQEQDKYLRAKLTKK
jgi:hypothetical protein